MAAAAVSSHGAQLSGAPRQRVQSHRICASSSWAPQKGQVEAARGPCSQIRAEVHSAPDKSPQIGPQTGRAPRHTPSKRPYK